MEISPMYWFFILSSRDDRLYFWNTETCAQECPPDQPTFRVSISSSNLQLSAAKGLDDSIEVWNLTTGTLQKKLTDRTHIFCNISFSPDSQVLAYQTASGAINLWDTTIRSPQPFLEGHSLYVNISVCSPDETTRLLGRSNRFMSEDTCSPRCCP